MNRIPPRLLLLVIVLLSMTPQAPAQTLASLVDKNRILLLFASTGQDPRLRRQLSLLSHHGRELEDRDLILLPVLAQPGPPATPDTLRTFRPPVLSDAEQLTLRHRFHVAGPDFLVILLGKDGREKLRSSTPIPLEHLARIIDAMPMRRQEMRERTPKPWNPSRRNPSCPHPSKQGSGTPPDCVPGPRPFASPLSSF